MIQQYNFSDMIPSVTAADPARAAALEEMR
jgi:hypothetical protein